MDKAQNELVKTYFRARTLALETGDIFIKYEILWAIDNNMLPDNYFDDKVMDIDGLTLMKGHRLYNFINDNPDKIEYVVDKLDHIGNTHAEMLISNHPSLAKYFRDYFKNP